MKTVTRPKVPVTTKLASTATTSSTPVTTKLGSNATTSSTRGGKTSGYVTETVIDLADNSDEDVEDEAAAQNALIYKFFDPLPNGYYHCHGCQKPFSSKVGNGNLHKHQQKCPGLGTAIKMDKPGITNQNKRSYAARQEQKEQATLDTKTLAVMPSFTQKGMNARFLYWMVSTNQPFMAVQHESFRTMVKFSNPSFNVPCNNTVKNHMKKCYDVSKQRLDDMLQGHGDCHSLRSRRVDG